jgi:hypothetical protein
MTGREADVDRASIMRVRGVESRSPTGYAEAFHARKVLLSPAG